MTHVLSDISNLFPFYLVHRVVENGLETVTIEEDGVLKSHTVNGQNMMITN